MITLYVSMFAYLLDPCASKDCSDYKKSVQKCGGVYDADGLIMSDKVSKLLQQFNYIFIVEEIEQKIHVCR